MAAPHQLLAASLMLLSKLQTLGKHVLRSADLPRMDRQRLQASGFIVEVVRGWYLPSRPSDPAGLSAAWFAGMREFIAGYCDERFGAEWHLSPDQSLRRKATSKPI